MAEKKSTHEKLSEAGRKGGEASHGGRGSEGEERQGVSREEAGRKGGEKVAEERGPEFYQQIGKNGGETVSEERGQRGIAQERLSLAGHPPPKPFTIFPMRAMRPERTAAEEHILAHISTGTQMTE